jgi:hypothetical protein
MPVVGLSFDKILVEKHSAVKGKVTVNNNVAIQDVEQSDVAIGGNKQSALKFRFEFTANYEPKIATMVLNGTLTFFETPEKAAEIVKTWKKDKNVPKDVMGSVLNTILARSNVEAMVLSREVNLPPPIPLPKVNIK